MKEEKKEEERSGAGISVCVYILLEMADDV
jgi:hypothetical protein